jgi:DNA-binding PadR family transcriptional regulator
MTDAELAILSIVAEGPIYGYDVQTVIAERDLRAWTNISNSSMYYVLEKLERQGLIASTGTADDAARRQYRITTAGYGVLQTSVADLISTPREYGSGFELGLANLHVLRVEQIRTAFITYKQDLLSRRGQACERLAKLKERDTPFNVIAMLEHHLALLQAELDWITTFIDKWEAQAPAEVPPTSPPSDEVPRMKQVVLPHDPDSLHRAPTRPIQHAAPSAQLNNVNDDDYVGSIPAEQPSETLPSSQTTLLSATTPPHMTMATPAEDDTTEEVINPKIHEDDASPPNNTAK